MFETLDEEVAAETLEEIDPKMQVSILSSLDSDRAADIVEEMDPDAAADLLGDMPPEATQEILTEMEPEERAEVSRADDLRGRHGRRAHDHRVHGAEGRARRWRMRSRCCATSKAAWRVSARSTLLASKAKLLGHGSAGEDGAGDAGDSADAAEHAATCTPSIPGPMKKRLRELFDKYNLLTLPVIDEEGVLTGVITADDVINMLRAKL